jgi:hypothetical protein
MWDDPAKIAAMEAEKNKPEPIRDTVAENLMADLERKAGDNVASITQARVMRLLTPVLLDMKAAFAAEDAAKVADMSRGILKGLGFGLCTTLHFVPPPYITTAIKILLEYATRDGLVGVESSLVPKEPKK